MSKVVGFAALFLGACAGIVGPRPCADVGLSLTARLNDSASIGPAISSIPNPLPSGWRIGRLPALVQVTVHNGTPVGRIVYLQCGANDQLHPVEVVVPAEMEQDITFAVPQRVFSTHFSCEIVGDRIGS